MKAYAVSDCHKGVHYYTDYNKACEDFERMIANVKQSEYYKNIIDTDGNIKDGYSVIKDNDGVNKVFYVCKTIGCDTKVNGMTAVFLNSIDVKGNNIGNKLYTVSRGWNDDTGSGLEIRYFASKADAKSYFIEVSSNENNDAVSMSEKDILDNRG